MESLLGPLSQAEAVEVLRRLGYRYSGRRFRMTAYVRRGETRPILLPDYREILSATMIDALEDVGIPADTLWDILREIRPILS